jgi:ABC-type protease/lipase transport system fused ATPase/permease subunit
MSPRAAAGIHDLVFSGGTGFNSLVGCAGGTVSARIALFRFATGRNPWMLTLFSVLVVFAFHLTFWND